MDWPKTIRKGNASVKIYRVKHATSKTGWMFELVWQSPEGRKKRKFADEASAVEEAFLKAGNLNAGRLGASDTASVLHRHYRELMRRDEAEAWFAQPASDGPAPLAAP